MKTKEKRIKHPDWQMTGSERKWYYISDTGRLFATMVLSNFLTVFLMFQGISAASVATSILIVKIIDALDDVLFGFIVDKVNPTKWKWAKKIAGTGKYMPWYRMTFWTFPLATIFFFLMPKDMPEVAKIVWFTVFYLLYDLTCTLSEVPMNSMIVTLTEKPEERNHILTVKGVITVIAAVLLAVVWSALISESVGLSITSVAVVSSLIFLVMMLPMCFKVKEHNTELKNVAVEEKSEKYTLKDMLKCVFTNKYIFIFFISTLVYSCLATQLTLQGFAAFYIFNNSMIYSYIMLIGFVPGILLSTQCGKIANKIGKRNAMLAIMLIMAACTIAQFFMRDMNVWFFIIIGGICAIPNALFSIVRNYIAPDTIEYTRYKTGKDCSGIFYSLNSFITKATGGVASALGLYILAIAGWKDVEAESFADLAAQGVQQSEGALNALWACCTLVPAAGCILAAIILLFYKLKDKDAELMAQCNAGLITREECETQLSRKY